MHMRMHMSNYSREMEQLRMEATPPDRPVQPPSSAQSSTTGYPGPCPVRFWVSPRRTTNISKI